MSLTSSLFLIFLFVCVLAYYILPKKLNRISLLVFSIIFYCYAMPNQLLIMMTYIWIIYVLGVAIHRATDRFKKHILIAGILISVGFLFFYKYTDFSFSLIVPIGISYITFQCIAYIVEVYKGKMSVINNPVSFFTYTLLFMKVTAGPIEAPKKFFDNFYSKKSIKWDDILSALTLMASGFVKKIVIADSLAPYISTVFDSPSGKDGLSIVLAAIMYSLQIYFDFSGYTDIARGSARLFGISLTENFNHPYMAKNVREFWHRWHISLSEWLKTYIYIPLGGSRVKTWRRYTNILLTFLVSGVWHGSSLTFVIWGLLHGFYQVMEIILEPIMIKLRRILHMDEEGIINTSLARIKTFILVTIAWMIFRASSLNDVVLLFKGIFNPWAKISEVFSDFMPDVELLILMLVAVAFVLLVEMLSKKSFHINIKTVIICVVAIWLVLLSIVFTAGTAKVNSFIYFDF